MLVTSILMFLFFFFFLFFSLRKLCFQINILKVIFLCCLFWAKMQMCFQFHNQTTPNSTFGMLFSRYIIFRRNDHSLLFPGKYCFLYQMKLCLHWSSFLNALHIKLIWYHVTHLDRLPHFGNQVWKEYLV